MAARPNALPEDPAVKIPDAVRRASARSTEIHNAAYQDPNAPPKDPPADTPTPDQVTPAPEPTPAPVQAQQTHQIPEASASGDSWESRYKAIKGRFDKSTQQVHGMGTRITELERMLALMQSAPTVVASSSPDPNAPELRAANLVTPEERESYGGELLDVIGRRAMETIQPELASRDTEIANLRRQLGGVSNVVVGNAHDNMIERLVSEVPEWEAQNANPDFLAWLALPDAYSGSIRQNMLVRAWEQNDTPRVLAFFKGFHSEVAAVAPANTHAAPITARPGLEKFAAPGRAKSAAATVPVGTPEKPVITRAQIAKFYADVGSGKYNDIPAKKASDEAMIFEAQRDGRIQ
jgi:hypothetical protein